MFYVVVWIIYIPRSTVNVFFFYGVMHWFLFYSYWLYQGHITSNIFFFLSKMMHNSAVLDFDTSPLPPTSKNKSGLVKVQFNAYEPDILTKCQFRLVAD